MFFTKINKSLSMFILPCKYDNQMNKCFLLWFIHEKKLKQESVLN
jgi:hypothetical protein